MATITATPVDEYQVRIVIGGYPTNTGHYPYIVRTQSGVPTVILDAAPANRKGTPPATMTVVDYPPFNDAVQYHVRMAGQTGALASSGSMKLTTTRVGVNLRDTRPDAVAGYDQVWCDLVSDERHYPSRTVTHAPIGLTQTIHTVMPPAVPRGTLTIRLDTLKERQQWASVRDSGWPILVRCTDQSEWQDGKIIVPGGESVRQWRAERHHHGYAPQSPRAWLVEVPYHWVGVETDTYIASLDSEPEGLFDLHLGRP